MAFLLMGNVPYYLSMPHAHTWYVYQRNAHHEYEDAPLDIWNNISKEEAIYNFMQLFERFRHSSARCIYLYKGIHRKARVSKESENLIIKSDYLEGFITHLNTYERVDIDTITVAP